MISLHRDEEHQLAHIIATKVFKWELITRESPNFATSVGTGYYDGDSYVCSAYNLPAWATSFKDAWSLIHHLEKMGWDFEITTRHEGRKCSRVNVAYLRSPVNSFHHYTAAEADPGKMPLALCRAVIKAADEINRSENALRS